METPQHSNLLYAPDCQKSCPSGGEAGHICAKGSGGTKPKAPMQRRTTMFKCEDKPNSSRQSSSLEMDEVTPYSRVVLAASFFTLFLGPSVNYATGVIHVALLDEFQEEVTLTAWIGSLFGCMFALMGPIASLVINVFNCRTCVVTAGVLCMLGFSTSFLVRDIRLLIVTYAIIAGAVFEHSGYYNSVFLYSVALLFATTLCGFLSTLTWRDRRQGIKAEDKFAESDFKDVSEIQDLTISVQNTENGEPLKEENDSSL